jgi:hypothetical protein
MSSSDMTKRDAGQPDQAQGDALFRIGGDGFPEKVFDRAEQSFRPVLLDVSSKSAYVTVHVSPVASYLTVRVYTHSTRAEVIRAVKDTRITLTGRTLTVEVPDRGIKSTAVYSGEGTVVVGGNASYISVGRNTPVIGGSGSLNDLIRVEVALPKGSRINSDLRSGDLTVFGALVGLEADSSSGDIIIKSVVNDVRARTSSGDVLIGRIASGAEIKTSSGDIWVGRYEGATIDLSSSSGDMDLTVEPVATGPVNLRTSSGDITLKGVQGRSVSDGGDLRITTLTSSGDVRRS